METDAPPVAELYHANVPAGLAGNVPFNITVPLPHLEAPIAEGAAGAV